MSKLVEFRQLEKHLAEQLQALEALKGDVSLKKEMEFESKLRDLLAQYCYSVKDVIKLLDPQTSLRTAATELKATKRKTRRLKIYNNPHTGEVVKTRGGNQKTLKEWKAKHGSDTVEAWLTNQ